MAAEQIGRAAQRLDAAQAGATKLCQEIATAAQRFEGVDRSLATTLSGLGSALDGFPAADSGIRDQYRREFGKSGNERCGDDKAAGSGPRRAFIDSPTEAAVAIHDFEEESDSYFASISDLMVGILFVFLLMLTVFALNYREAEHDQEIRRQQFEREAEKARLAEERARLAEEEAQQQAARADRHFADCWKMLGISSNMISKPAPMHATVC